MTKSPPPNQPQEQQNQHGEEEVHGCRFKDGILQKNGDSQDQTFDSMLPDDIIVRIGKSVVKYCGVRDYIRFSRTSKRLHKLLIDSEETISEIIRDRTSDLSSMLLPSASPETVIVHNLEQLELYEAIAAHNILEENRIHFEFADLEIDNTKSNSFSLIFALQKILLDHPSVSVLLEAHCGTPAPTEIALLYSHFRGRVACEAILNRQASDYNREVAEATPMDQSNENFSSPPMLSEHRVRIRAWGKRVAQNACQSRHPYSALAKEGRGWVEVFLRMEGPDPTTTLELPPRPDFYRDATTPLELSAFTELFMHDPLFRFAWNDMGRQS